MSKRKTLSERLAGLTSAAPSAEFNPDAPDFDDGTGAGLSSYSYADDDGTASTEAFSGDLPAADLRVAADMESIGMEYHGQRVSRKSLEAGSGVVVGDAPDPDASESVDSSADEQADGSSRQGASAAIGLNLDDVSSSSEEEGVSEEEESDSEREEGQESGNNTPRNEPRLEQASVFTGLRGDDVDATVEEQMMQLDRQDEKARRGRGARAAGQGELKRAREALRQRQWWDSLLEVRILLQRLMNAANNLPGPNELPLFLEGDDSLADLAAEGAAVAEGLATTLSCARRSQMACWGITNDAQGIVDAAVEGEEAEEGEESAAARDHVSCMEWWQGVLGRWHDKTRLVDPGLQKKFRAVNQGPWVQITASLADRERTNRRAFMTESETKDFLGRKLARRLKASDVSEERAEGTADDAEEEAAEVLGRERRKQEVEPLDLEVLDDRDLYQHLLKEFMDASGAAGNAYGTSAAVSVRRKSHKKAIDRRASKGRKIKYVTHPKMQNFMFPQEYEPPPMEPSELFASLFGGAGNPQQHPTRMTDGTGSGSGAEG